MRFLGSPPQYPFPCIYPSPTITSISYPDINGNYSVAVNGSGYLLNASIINFNNVAMTTNFINTTELSTALSTAQFNSLPGNVTVTNGLLISNTVEIS